MLNLICVLAASWMHPAVSVNRRAFRLARKARHWSFFIALGLAGFLLAITSALAAPPVKRVGTTPVKHAPTVKSVQTTASVNNEAWAKKVNAELAAGQLAYNQKRYTESERLARLLLPELSNPRFTVAGRAGVYQLLGLSLMEGEGSVSRLVDARRYLALSNDILKTAAKPEFAPMRLNNRFYIAQADALIGHPEEAVAEYQALLKENLPTDRITYAKQMLSALTHSDNATDYFRQFTAPYTHWQGLATRPLRIYIQDGSALEDWRPEYPVLVQKAYAEWRSQLPVLNFAFVDRPDQADTIVNWTPDPIVEADTAKQELGRCELQYRGSIIQKDDITLSLHNMGHVPVTAKSLYEVSLHEIGHSLGLTKAHSNNPSDIMFASTLLAKGSSGHLTARDIATMKALYAQPAGYTNPDVSLASYRQYANLSKLASEAMIKQDYTESINLARQALGIDDNNPEARYTLGASLYSQKAYEAALPELLQVVNKDGIQQPHAYLLVTSCLINIAQIDFRADNRARGLQHLQMAQDFINLHRGRMVLNPELMAEQAKMEQALQLSMQFTHQDINAGRNSADVFVLPNKGKLADESETSDSKKKKGWWARFLDASAASEISVPVRLPIPASAF